MKLKNLLSFLGIIACLSLPTPLTAETAAESNYVDLGLPSGTLWATKNVGASDDVDWGGYYAWGETQTKRSYTWSNYVYGYDGYHLTKYQNDGKMVLEPQDDVAYRIMGPRWRMPTKEDFQELIDNCDIRNIRSSYWEAYEFTSKINGEHIRIPIYNSDPRLDAGSAHALYWTSSITDTNTGNAYCFDGSYLGFVMDTTIGRYVGMCIRAVMDSCNLSVREGVFIKGQTKMECYAGTAYDVSGLDVCYLKEGQSAKTVTADAVWSFEPAFITADCPSVSITASYNGLTSTPITTTVSIIADVTPTFSLKPGSYEGAQIIAISSEVEDAKIYYTLDGTDPTTSSTEYTGPFIVDDTVTVKAITSYSTFLSVVATAEYKISMPEYVDLGLESGLLWASKNVGAEKTGDFGNYYAWGETETKTEYTTDNYAFNAGSGTFSKYQGDSKPVLEQQDDAAYVNWGPRWRMPSKEDYQELMDNCTSKWVSLNGVNGCLMTSNINSHSVFFPQADFMPQTEQCVYFWTSTVYMDDNNGYVFRFRCNPNENPDLKYSQYRSNGASVRPVMDLSKVSITEGVYIKGEITKKRYDVADKLDISTLDAYYIKEGGIAEKVTDAATFTVDPAVIPQKCTFASVTATYNGMTSDPVTAVISTSELAPVFTPIAGAYPEARTVTITSEVKNAKIYYTLDGTDPTTSSALYSEPIVVSENIVIKAIAVVGEFTSSVMTAEYKISASGMVDLGLPSGTLWATFNVGATKPEEYGNYYAWGDIVGDPYAGKTSDYSKSFNPSTDPFNGGSRSVDENYFRSHKSEWLNGDMLKPEYDAARQVWGGDWRMPTKALWDELNDNCYSEWTEDYNGTGVKGKIVYKKKNTGTYDVTKDVHIFFPATGFRANTGLSFSGSSGYYWSANYNYNDFRYAHSNRLSSYENKSECIFRDYGLSVRPVKSTLPDIVPAANSYFGSHTVMILSNVKDATIYYTLDGTTPTTSSTVYTEPFVLYKNTTVKAITVKDGEKSSVASAEYKIVQGELIDLGLPSGTLWASYDIGGEPEECDGNLYYRRGSYFRWGETAAASSNMDPSTYRWLTDPKYLNGDLNQLEPQDDAAYVHWGPRWHTPTKEEWRELLDNCTLQYDGTTGDPCDPEWGRIIVTSKKNGKSILLSLQGYLSEIGGNRDAWSSYYMSSSLDKRERDHVAQFIFKTRSDYSSDGLVSSTYGHYGLHVRPVMDPFNASDHVCVGVRGQLAKTKYQVGEVFDFTGLDAYYIPVMDIPTKVVDGVIWNASPTVIPIGCTSVSVTATYEGMTSAPFKVSITTSELTPVISPEKCSFIDKMEVTITSEVEKATIYFTLDGTNPTTQSTVYAKPITINSSVTVKAIAVVGNFISDIVTASYIKISDYVDLGLPSGTLWATHNMGATRPEECGNYYSWGEVKTKNDYNRGNYVFGGGSFDPGYFNFTKYKNDGKTVLEPQDDAAYINLGPRWCIPTADNYKELMDNCTFQWTMVGGEEGCLFTSNINGNGIFFPAGDFLPRDLTQHCVYYWASTVGDINTGYANRLRCNEGETPSIGLTEWRFHGTPIRPVIHAENINVQEGVYISGAPATTSYLAGSVFDVAGLDVYYVKEGAASIKVTEDATWTFDPAVIPVDGKYVSVTASYNGLTSAPITVAVTTDNFAPVFTPAAGSYVGLKAVTITCTDKNAKIYYTLDGKEPTTSSNQYSEPIILDDDATIKAFVVNGDKQSKVMTASYTIDYELYVDLGLSSRLLWASMNIGSASIIGYGNGGFYAWGETQTKSSYTWGNYKYGHGMYNLTKYQNDGKTVLEPQDDAAYVNWGPRWRMPTNVDFSELFEECDYVRIEYYDQPGVLFTSKTNGNSIFLPAAGNKNETLDEGLYYWASTVYSNPSGMVYRLKWAKGGNPSIGRSDYPYYGGSVRPVMDAGKESVEEGIYIKGQTHTTKYYAGETFDLSKLDVYYIKEGGISENVTGSATLTASPSIIPVGCKSVTVTASYKGMKATPVKVTVATEVRAVDLGLTKRWAEFNLGTCIPSEYGNYYPWSESLTSNDVAATLGSGWGLPNMEDVKELQDTSKCVWEWFEPGNTEYGGTAGYRVTGKKTGNSIFLPAAGTMSAPYFRGAGQVGNYWTSERGSKQLSDSYYMCFDMYDQCTGLDSHSGGKTVRAVKK